MKDYQIKTVKNNDTKALDVTLEGHLNVSNIYEIQKDFNKAVKNNKKINLEISQVDDADITIIQLIEAFKLNCKSSDIELTVKYNLNSETSELFKRAGLNSIIN